MKKRGFGVGKWNGPGGKPNAGESIEQAVVREVYEEVNVTPLLIQKVAVLDFYFPDVPSEKNWDQRVSVFTTDTWKGDPTESEEMAPKWFRIEEIPYDQMWPDDILWMPKVFAGQKVKAEFIFSGEGKLKESKFDELDETGGK